MLSGVRFFVLFCFCFVLFFGKSSWVEEQKFQNGQPALPSQESPPGTFSMRVPINISEKYKLTCNIVQTNKERFPCMDKQPPSITELLLSW